MSIGAVSSTTPSAPVQSVRPAGRDNDGDEATESKAAKAKEAQSTALATSGSRGTKLNALV
jgi:hypothetical protein